MKYKKLILTASVCLFSGCLSNVTALAATHQTDTIPVATQEYSHRITPGKGRIRTSAKAVSVKFRRCKFKLSPGQKKRIRVTIRPSIATEKPVFESENPTIAIFIKGDMIYAKQAGTTYVTATLSNGRKARCRIIVKTKKKNHPMTTKR